MKSTIFNIAAVAAPGLVALTTVRAIRAPAPIHRSYSVGDDTEQDRSNCIGESTPPPGFRELPLIPAGPEGIRIDADKASGYVEVMSKAGVLMSRARYVPRRGTEFERIDGGCGPSSHFWVDVCESAAGRGYYIEVSTECDSGCCDLDYLPIDLSGRRLDDSLKERLLWRLGWSGISLLSTIAIVAFLVLIRSLWLQPRTHGG